MARNKENTEIFKRSSVATQAESHYIQLTATKREFDALIQTDFFLDRPLTPHFVPTCLNTEVSTQIESGDLFDFDKEVVPLLEVLVGKTLELAMLEVLEEEEIKALHQRQFDFEQRRNAELVEAQRMEAAERRRTEEKERRKNQELARVKREEAIVKKLLAHKISKLYLARLSDDLLVDLEKNGKFDNLAEIEVVVIPQIIALIKMKTQEQQEAKLLVETLFKF